jgi:hypothetical protein
VFAVMNGVISAWLPFDGTNTAFSTAGTRPVAPKLTPSPTLLTRRAATRLCSSRFETSALDGLPLDLPRLCIHLPRSIGADKHQTI